MFEGLFSGSHMIIILIVALLIFGKRLPEVARSLGRSINEFKKGLKEAESEAVQAPAEPVAPPRAIQPNPPAAALPAPSSAPALPAPAQATASAAAPPAPPTSSAAS